MTGEHLKKVLQQYYKHWDELWTVPPVQMGNLGTAHKAQTLTSSQRAAHYKFMCLEAQKFVDEGRIEKAMRWLGFIQGVLWHGEYFTLDELKEHSRPGAERKS